MEKTGEIRPGVTPEVKEPEKRACIKCTFKIPFNKQVTQLEDDAVNRLVKQVSK